MKEFIKSFRKLSKTKFLGIGIILMLIISQSACEKAFEALKLSKVDGLRSVSTVGADDPESYPRVINITGQIMTSYTDANFVNWDFYRFEISFSQPLKASTVTTSNIKAFDVDDKDQSTQDGGPTSFDAEVSLHGQNDIVYLQFKVFNSCAGAPADPCQTNETADPDFYSTQNEINEIKVYKAVTAENGKELIGNTACDNKLQYCRPNDYIYCWTAWAGGSSPPDNTGGFPNGAVGYFPNDTYNYLLLGPTFQMNAGGFGIDQINVVANITDFDSTNFDTSADVDIFTITGGTGGPNADDPIFLAVGNISGSFTGLTANTEYTVSFNENHVKFRAMYEYPNDGVTREYLFGSPGVKNSFINRYSGPPSESSPTGTSDFKRTVWTAFDTTGGSGDPVPQVTAVTPYYSYVYTGNESETDLGGSCFTPSTYPGEGDYNNDGFDNALYVGPGNGEYYWNGSCSTYVYVGGESTLALYNGCYTPGVGDYNNDGSDNALYVGSGNGSYYYNYSACPPSGTGNIVYQGGSFLPAGAGNGTYISGGDTRYNDGTWAADPGDGTYNAVTTSYIVEFNQLMNHNTLGDIRGFYDDVLGNPIKISSSNLDIINSAIDDQANPFTLTEITNKVSSQGIDGFIISGSVRDADDNMGLDGNDGGGSLDSDGALQGDIDSNGNGRFDDSYYYGSYPDGP